MFGFICKFFYVSNKLLDIAMNCLHTEQQP